MTSTRRICIIAFKNASSTIHVLRQIYYLAPHYELTVIGHGSPDPAWPELTWHAMPVATVWSKIERLMWYAIGRVVPSACRTGLRYAAPGPARGRRRDVIGKCCAMSGTEGGGRSARSVLR